MAKINFCELWLTCFEEKEADRISKALLEKKLIACAKQIPVESSFVWKSKIETENETLLIIESREDLFNEIEKEVAKLHSYDTFVLTATPITKISRKAAKWLEENLKK